MQKKSRTKYFIFFFLVIVIVFVGLFFLNKSYVPITGTIQNLNSAKKVESKSFSFAVAGDNHSNLEVYDEIIGKVNASQADFFVDLGDTTRVGGASEYADTQAVLNKLKVPYHMVIGQHDIVGNGQEIWQEYYGPTYYSWDYENAHFVALDDVTDPNVFSEVELSWFQRDLSSSSKNLKFVFLHVPPRCPFVSAEELGFTGPLSNERIDKFIDIAKKYKVSKIYAAHIHNYLNYAISGIPITVTGGAGGPIYNIPLIGTDKFHYLNIDVLGSDFKQKVVEL
jgi:hypothetical protein